MKRWLWHLALIAVLSALIGPGIAVGKEYIVNGDFETGDFSAWFQSGWS